jgi:hypothetical protein
MHTSRKCSTLIHALAKSAILSWGLNHEALHTIHKGAILPIMLYDAPVWIDGMEKRRNKVTYRRVQQLMNIEIAIVYRMTSNEALCILTGTTPIDTKAGETAKLYRITRDRQNDNWTVT